MAVEVEVDHHSLVVLLGATLSVAAGGRARPSERDPRVGGEVTAFSASGRGGVDAGRSVRATAADGPGERAGDTSARRGVEGSGPLLLVPFDVFDVVGRGTGQQLVFGLSSAAAVRQKTLRPPVMFCKIGETNVRGDEA